MNHEPIDTSHAAVAETVITPDGANTWFGRMEITGKPAHALHVHESADVFTVGKVQGGYVRYFDAWNGAQPGVGVSLSASIVPRLLAPRYDGRVAPGIGVFFTTRPAPHAMAGAATTP
jgi:hypothetical protein